MNQADQRYDELAGEIKELRARLAEAEETLDAIRTGAVDAVVVSNSEGEKVYTLEGSDSVYRRFFEAMSQGAVTLNTGGTILSCNRAFSDMVEVPIDRILGTSFHRFVSPPDAGALDGLLAQASESAASADIDVRLGADPHVRTRTTIVTAFPLESADRPLICALLTDITDRKRYEQSLSRYATMLEAQNRAHQDFLEETDTSQLFSGLLQSALHITGSEHGYISEVYSTPDLGMCHRFRAVSRPGWMLDLPGFCGLDCDADAHRNPAGPLAASVLSSGEPLIVNSPAGASQDTGPAAGDVEITSFMALPILKGPELVGTVAVANRPGGYNRKMAEWLEPFVSTCSSIMAAKRSHEERKTAEDALRSSEAQKQAILDGIRTSLAFVNEDLEVRWTNKAAAARLGLTVNETLGRKCHELWMHLPVPCEDCPTIRAFRTGRQEHQEMTRPEGTVWTINSVPVRSQGGVLSGVLEIMEDITEQKKTQALVLQSEKYRAVVDLTRGVAHNFNNLLQIVLGNADLAFVDLETGGFTDLKDRLNEIATSARFGAETVRRLRRFAKDSVDGPARDPEVFDLKDVVEQALEMARPFWKDEPAKRGVAVSLDYRLNPGCLIRGSKAELFEVVVNLLRNAVEALHEDGCIEIDVARETDSVILRVRDTGVGIPPRHLTRLFTPFFTTSVEAGRGLGLATCRTIVDSHGGQILVDSVEGQHTTFTVRLPFAGEQAGFQAPAQPSSPPDQVTFLVIDDLEATVKLLKSGLERENHTVFTALSGEDGLALLEAHIVDVVICDLGMPGMSGWQVGEAISERSLSTGRPKPKFIMLTGWADQAAETERIAAAKVDAIIEKPVDMAELLQVIRQVIRSD